MPCELFRMHTSGPVAQWLEQGAHNALVVSSILTRPTIRRFATSVSESEMDGCPPKLYAKGGLFSAKLWMASRAKKHMVAGKAHDRQCVAFSWVFPTIEAVLSKFYEERITRIVDARGEC